MGCIEDLARERKKRIANFNHSCKVTELQLLERCTMSKWKSLHRHDCQSNMYVIGSVYCGYFIVNVLEDAQKRGIFSKKLAFLLKGPEVEKLWDKIRAGKSVVYSEKEKNYALTSTVTPTGDGELNVHIHERIKTREGVVECEYSSKNTELFEIIREYSREHNLMRKWEKQYGM